MEIDAYKPGDRDDFDRLYRACHGRLLGTLIVILGDRSAAEDCCQEAFVHAFKAWPRWRPEAPAEAWLHRIGINTALSHRRRQKLREVGEVVRRLGRPEPGPDPTEATLSWDLAAALRRLPPKQAAAIVLRHYHGYSNREIAASLGIPERTVASRLSSAKQRLRTELDRDQSRGLGTLRGAGVSGVSDG